MVFHHSLDIAYRWLVVPLHVFRVIFYHIVHAHQFFIKYLEVVLHIVVRVVLALFFVEGSDLSKMLNTCLDVNHHIADSVGLDVGPLEKISDIGQIRFNLIQSPPLLWALLLYEFFVL